jgi:hypothetical protein
MIATKWIVGGLAGAAVVAGGVYAYAQTNPFEPVEKLGVPPGTDDFAATEAGQVVFGGRLVKGHRMTAGRAGEYIYATRQPTNTFRVPIVRTERYTLIPALQGRSIFQDRNALQAALDTLLQWQTSAGDFAAGLDPRCLIAFVEQYAGPCFDRAQNSNLFNLRARHCVYWNEQSAFVWAMGGIQPDNSGPWYSGVHVALTGPNVPGLQRGEFHFAYKNPIDSLGHAVTALSRGYPAVIAAWRAGGVDGLVASERAMAASWYRAPAMLRETRARRLWSEFERVSGGRFAR